MGLSQEGLKLIACVCMLIDHIGVLFFPQMDSFRIIGRISFPIFCFLLAEGAHYTRNPKKYAGRLALGVLLSEIPFDLAIYGGYNPRSCSVMVTLLLGYGAVVSMGRVKGVWKGLAVLPFFFLAELLGTDYAGHGIAIIAWFALVRDLERAALWRFLGLVILLQFGYPVPVGPFWVPMELFGLLSLIPIHFYRGEKRTTGNLVKWSFYLFYPVHLLVLWGILNFVQ